MRDRQPLLPSMPQWDLTPADAKILRDLGIDPEVEETSVDEEYNNLFNFMDDLRRRRGKGVWEE